MQDCVGRLSRQTVTSGSSLGSGNMRVNAALSQVLFRHWFLMTVYIVFAQERVLITLNALLKNWGVLYSSSETLQEAIPLY